MPRRLRHAGAVRSLRPTSPPPGAADRVLRTRGPPGQTEDTHRDRALRRPWDDVGSRGLEGRQQRRAEGRLTTTPIVVTMPTASYAGGDRNAIRAARRCYSSTPRRRQEITRRQRATSDNQTRRTDPASRVSIRSSKTVFLLRSTYVSRVARPASETRSPGTEDSRCPSRTARTDCWLTVEGRSVVAADRQGQAAFRCIGGHRSRVRDRGTVADPEPRRDQNCSVPCDGERGGGRGHPGHGDTRCCG